MDRLRERLEVARKALVIQRFEYTYEAVWKTAQLYLRNRENLELASPSSVTRACFQSLF